MSAMTEIVVGVPFGTSPQHGYFAWVSKTVPAASIASPIRQWSGWRGAGFDVYTRRAPNLPAALQGHQSTGEGK